MLATAYSSTTRSMTHIQTRSEKILLAAKTWGRVTVTWLYIVIFSIVYIGGGISAILVAASASRSVTIVAILAFTVKLLYLCLATVWMMALVISVIGEEYYGLSSILEAGKFIKEKKFHGLSLMVLFMAPFIANLALIRFMFLWFRADAIFCVFYLECLKSHGERDGRDGDQELKVVVVDVNQLK
ncbi:hypothetical protein J5N97_003298 [Dioscorea zingiberensis]|uniref:Transmembrane protein n=1 Tax=Dioscorea zingiberensis TaxID=325984 RepID=A0A9D5D5W6_9LILI|nr:hypothetical protein J5N97_003298 [Dioscorea zingiberensis]